VPGCGLRPKRLFELLHNNFSYDFYNAQLAVPGQRPGYKKWGNIPVLSAVVGVGQCSLCSCHTDKDADTHTNADSNSHTDANSDANADPDTDSHANSNTTASGDQHADADSDFGGNRHTLSK